MADNVPSPLAGALPKEGNKQTANTKKKQEPNPNQKQTRREDLVT
jgi:hypothetical protein